MQRYSRTLTTSAAVMLCAAVAAGGALAVGSSNVTHRSIEAVTSPERAGRAAQLLDGVVLDLATARLFATGDVLPAGELLVIVEARVRVAGREIELPSAEIVVDLSVFGGSPMMEGGTSHVCALEDGVTWATADGGCKDLVTGLVWSTENLGVGGAITYPYAEQLMADADEGGFTDWRFPSVEEMEAVAAHGAATHFRDFSCSPNSGYWSNQRQGRRRYATNVCTGETRLFQDGNIARDAISFVAVREASTGSFCGDGTCDPDETPCNCPADCGPPPASESSCANGVDDDCDGLVDCADSDCDGTPGCTSACNNNGICEPGEDCETCSSDCDSKLNGPPSGRYCCGNGILEGPEGDGRCDGNH